MKKIKRIVVNVLSPEEMRQVTVGGKQVRCGTFSCYAEVQFSDGRYETYAGTCSKGTRNGYVYCYCATSGGNFVSTKPDATNECEL